MKRSCSWLRPARHGVAGAVLVGVFFFLRSEAQRHWAPLSARHVALSPRQLCAGLALGLAYFAFETRAWQRAVNAVLGRQELTFVESVAITNLSGLLKYLPGRVWTYGAQMLWLGRRGVTKTEVVSANLVCLSCSVLVSTSLAAVYAIVYLVPARLAPFSFVGMIVAHVAILLAGPRIVAASLRLLRRFTGGAVEVDLFRLRSMLELDLLYTAGWLAMGAAGYFSGLGVGLRITPHEVVAIIGSTSLSSIIGHLSALTPGGLGVREAVMFVMLDEVGTPDAALVLPVVSRLLYLMIETALGVLGFWIGMRRGLFGDESRASDQRKLS